MKIQFAPEEITFLKILLGLFTLLASYMSGYLAGKTFARNIIRTSDRVKLSAEDRRRLIADLDGKPYKPETEDEHALVR
jgi:hypothetical protein